jgi:acetyl-CoA acetyltransferase
MRADDMAAFAIKSLVVSHPGIVEGVDEVFFGCVNHAGEDNRNVARMSLLLAGMPTAVQVPGATSRTRTVIERDEQPRADTTLDALSKLKPIVRDGGTVTAGNASSINDGSAALLVASGAAAEKYGLTPRAMSLGFASAGVAPRVMGVGPLPAVEKITARLELRIADFDVIELNEAFASQVLACIRRFGVGGRCGTREPPWRVDRAGAPAGHVGCTHRRRRGAGIATSCREVCVGGDVCRCWTGGRSGIAARLVG